MASEAGIYAHQVRHGVAAEMAESMKKILDAGLPYLVGCIDGTIAG